MSALHHNAILICSTQWSRIGRSWLAKVWSMGSSLFLTKVHLHSFFCCVESFGWCSIVFRVQTLPNLVQAMQGVKDVQHHSVVAWLIGQLIRKWLELLRLPCRDTTYQIIVRFPCLVQLRRWSTHVLGGVPNCVWIDDSVVFDGILSWGCTQMYSVMCSNRTFPLAYLVIFLFHRSLVGISTYSKIEHHEANIDLLTEPTQDRWSTGVTMLMLLRQSSLAIAFREDLWRDACTRTLALI